MWSNAHSEIPPPLGARIEVRLGRLWRVEVSLHWAGVLFLMAVGAVLGGLVFPTWHPGWGPWAAAAAAAVTCLLLLGIAQLHEIARAWIARVHGSGVAHDTSFLVAGVGRLEVQPPSPRAEILAALANAVALVVIAVVIFIEAYERWFDPPEVHGALMMGIATGGLLVNLAGLAILHRGRSESLNVRGAWLHVLGDALGSVGAMASGAVIWAFGWQRADPIASVAIGVLVLYASIQLLRESVHVLMAGAPAAMDVDDIRATIEGIDGVRSLHDLHVWTITSGMDCLSGHVVADAEADHQRLLATLQRVLLERFGVDHATLQIEAEGHEEVEPRF
ncbi:MAG: cation diffusion facilitator family transporter [Myxococcales bacterium]|nr:cation diffusion facilitator family transporter [Myxococcales bacterium]